MSSAATHSFTTPAPPEAVAAGLDRVIAEKRYQVGERSPDGGRFLFRTRKTMLNWELDVLVTIAPSGGGSTVDMHLDGAPGRPPAMLDGVKNRKAIEKLAEQIQAATA